jgi:NhaP-type Na+/H+ or K+/H+ antiporter
MVSWFLLVGAVLVVMAFAGRWVARMPLSFALVYLAVGFAIGPDGVNLVAIDLVAHGGIIEILAEVAVLISLFAVGLRLNLPLAWKFWRTPIKLATSTMLLTIAGIALAAHALLGFDWPVAVLLGAVLAPTDPVLASDVQVRHADDRDALRLALTAEGGLNDGTAFPAVILGLMLIGAAPDFSRWVWHDVVWAIAGAVALGTACGLLLAWAVARIRRSSGGLEFEEFLALGMIALTYGAALATETYGFIAVFVAGLAFAQAKFHGPRPRPSAAAAPGSAQRLLVFTTQCERLAEVALVLLIGAALWTVSWSLQIIAFGATLMLIVRPLATLITIRTSELSRLRRRLLAWFGIRGIGSVYYATYAMENADYAPWMHEFASATLVAIAMSIAAHGASATPLMNWMRARRSAPESRADVGRDENRDPKRKKAARA